jgi:hypothetical protein
MYSIKACMPVCILETEREDIGSIWSRVTCLAFRLLLLRVLSFSFESSRTTKRLNDNDRKQAIQEINKTVHQTVLKYSTRRYERVGARNT